MGRRWGRNEGLRQELEGFVLDIFVFVIFCCKIVFVMLSWRNDDAFDVLCASAENNAAISLAAVVVAR